MKMVIPIILMFFLIQILTGCNDNTNSKLSTNGKIAKVYLENKGYEIVTYRKRSSITFTKDKLQSKPYRDMWAVQSITPDKYIDKQIDAETFNVKKHPLNKVFKNEGDFSGDILVNVWVLNGKVIGGTSYPVYKSNSGVGLGYSLEGKTAEEVKRDYQNWLKNFEDIYGMKD
ncbi:hypothetical protein HPT25_27020 [Bacillus sp. BRMEA1]|uniref:hypothetical protein n=1 Tax=Neobacillus endophyticus TaxID=2738405 RepID=UPI001563D7BD|nr:hypothetical protein [Neobacillus endophyticus]NRD80979.1 hypothetical protein [Neobacillus endophyticus]